MRKKRVDAQPTLAQACPGAIKRHHFITTDPKLMQRFVKDLVAARMKFTFEDRIVDQRWVLLVRAPGSSIALYDRIWEIAGGRPRHGNL